MKENPANKIKDTMSFKEYVYDLIQMTTQKTAGQNAKFQAKGHINWDDLDMTLMSIVIEATALVLSGRLDGLEKGDGEDEKT